MLKAFYFSAERWNNMKHTDYQIFHQINMQIRGRPFKK